MWETTARRDPAQRTTSSRLPNLLLRLVLRARRTTAPLSRRSCVSGVAAALRTTRATASKFEQAAHRRGHFGLDLLPDDVTDHRHQAFLSRHSAPLNEMSSAAVPCFLSLVHRS